MKLNFVVATLVALMLVTGLAITASAQTAQPTTTPVAGACANGNFVDANNDGVCDNAPRDGSGMQFGQQNGKGMNRGQDQGRGMQGRGMQNGQGQGMGQGTGHGASFVDENKDGVCDNFGTMQGGARNGQGMQGRGMQGRGMQGGQGWNN